MHQTNLQQAKSPTDKQTAEKSDFKNGWKYLNFTMEARTWGAKVSEKRGNSLRFHAAFPLQDFTSSVSFRWETGKPSGKRWLSRAFGKNWSSGPPREPGIKRSREKGAQESECEDLSCFSPPSICSFMSSVESRWAAKWKAMGRRLRT